MIFSAQDLDTFFGDFAQEATLYPGEDDERVIDVIYRPKPGRVGFSGSGRGARVELGLNQPTIAARSADLEGVASGARVLIDGRVYTLAKSEPDGSGISRAALRKATA